MFVCLKIQNCFTQRIYIDRLSFADGTSALSTKHRKDTAMDLKQIKQTPYFFLYVNYKDISPKLQKIYHITNMYIIKSSIIHLFSYGLYEIIHQNFRNGASGPSPFSNQNPFVLFVNLQNIEKIKLEFRLPFLKILDPALNLAALTTTYIGKRHRNFELKNKLD